MTRRSDTDVPHTTVHRLSRRLLEPAQDLLVLGIALALFGWMVRSLVWLFRGIFTGLLDFRGIIAEALFMLVMVDVVRLVIIYLQEHRVAVAFMVELGILATLRDGLRSEIGNSHRIHAAANIEVLIYTEVPV